MKVLVMLPTLNEKENIAALIIKIFELPIANLEIVVVDDQSPDGTARIVEDLTRTFARLHLIRRSGPGGRGLAGREGYIYGLKSEMDFLVEMDGDFSHDPKHIPSMLDAMSRCDLAIGSRFVAGGADLDRPFFRHWLTIADNAYARSLLGLEVRDTNSGFRCFSREALARIAPESLRSRGPSIVHEVLFKARRARLRIAEIPIEFVDRKKGSSKLNLARLAAGYLWILKMRLGPVHK